MFDGPGVMVLLRWIRLLKYMITPVIPPPKITIIMKATSTTDLEALFRIILAIPVFIAVYVLGLVAELVGIVSWLVIVITSGQPAGLQSALRFAVSFSVRAMAYVTLVMEEWPSFADTEPGQEPGPSAPFAAAGG